MQRRIVKMQPAHESIGFSLAVYLDECPDRMGVEIIQDQRNSLDLWVDDIYEITHHFGEVLFGASLSHQYLPPSSLGFNKDENIACAMPNIFMILALRYS